MHPGARAEPVLAAWGITTDGAPVFVTLAAGGSESADAWGDFLDGLRGRGLRPPLLVISDGAAGLINAAESVLARSLRQKCLIHRARNVLAKVPATAQDQVRATYWAIFDTDALTTADLDSGSGTPTSSSAPSARPAAGSRSSADFPAKPAASTSSGPSWTATSSGPSWTAPAEDGAA